jgi:hypothetical protein
MVTNRGFDVAPFTTISELGSKAHAHLVFIRPLSAQVITNGSINDPSFGARAPQASLRSLRKLAAGKSTQPAQTWQRASLEGWAALQRGDRARQRRSGRCRGRRSRPSASCREFRSGRGSDKRTASTPTDACQRSRRVRPEAGADGFLVDEMSRVILNGYRCARSRCAECLGKQSALGGVRRNRR